MVDSYTIGLQAIFGILAFLLMLSAIRFLVDDSMMHNPSVLATQVCLSFATALYFGGWIGCIACIIMFILTHLFHRAQQLKD